MGYRFLYGKFAPRIGLVVGEDFALRNSCSRDGLPVEPKSAYSVLWRNARSKSGATGNGLRSLKR
jgi:hypothetical protein